MDAEFDRLVDASLRILQSDFYQKNERKIKNQESLNLVNHSRGYSGLLTVSELVSLSLLNKTFNYACSGLSYVRMHPSYVKFSKREIELKDRDVEKDTLTSYFLNYGTLFDGPFLCLTHSEDMHLAVSNVQQSLRAEDRFSVNFCRIYDDMSDENPVGSVHPIKAAARRCITYLPSSPVVVLSDLSYVFELCRIWDYPIPTLCGLITAAIEKKLDDVKFSVRLDCSRYARHKNKMEFDRSQYLRDVYTVYIPFPGIVVCSMAFPVLKAEFINAHLMPDTMFQWSEQQFLAYDTPEKIAGFRENGCNKMPIEAL